MTFGFLASATLMEMSTHMKKMGIKALAEWAPREGNQQADALTNGCYDAFDLSSRIPVNPRTLKRDVLLQALLWRKEAEEAFQRTKAAGKLLQTYLFLVFLLGCSTTSRSEPS